MNEFYIYYPSIKKDADKLEEYLETLMINKSLIYWIRYKLPQIIKEWLFLKIWDEEFNAKGFTFIISSEKGYIIEYDESENQKDS